jgi:hypothetical protein
MLLSLRGAKATKQSRTAYAVLDCFVEPVIRRRPAPTGWLAMTELVVRAPPSARSPARRGLFPLSPPFAGRGLG